jgi:hypothetical protein
MQSFPSKPRFLGDFIMRWPREPQPCFRSATGSWYVQLDRQISLGKDHTEAAIAYHKLMADHYSRGPLDADIARLVAEFVLDIDVEPATADWYKR